MSPRRRGPTTRATSHRPNARLPDRRRPRTPLYERLRAAGVDSFFSPPVEVDTGANKGGFALYLRDPDGIILELFQPPRDLDGLARRHCPDASRLTIRRIETIPIRVPLGRVYRGSGYHMTHRSTIVTRVHTDEGIVGEAYAGDEDATLGEIDRIIQHEIAPRARGRGRARRRALLGARAAGDLRHPARPAPRPRRVRLRRHRDLGRGRQGARPAALAALGRLPPLAADDRDRRVLRHRDPDRRRDRRSSASSGSRA